MGGVQVRRLRAPESGVRDRHGEIRPLAGYALYRDSDGLGSLDADDRRVDAHRADLHTLRLNTVLGPDPEVHRAVDPAAGIPAGIGAGGVVGDDEQTVVLPDLQLSGQVNEEIGVAVEASSHGLAVERDRGVHVYTLELQHDTLSVPFRLAEQIGLVVILPSGEEARGCSVGAIRRTVLHDHGVMGQHDGLLLILVSVLPERPGLVQSFLLHKRFSFHWQYGFF